MGIGSGLDIVHIDLYLSYLKISGVLGLGGGSAAYQTFKRNEGGQDSKERRGRKKRLLEVIRASFQTRKSKKSLPGPSEQVLERGHSVPELNAGM